MIDDSRERQTEKERGIRREIFLETRKRESLKRKRENRNIR